MKSMRLVSWLIVIGGSLVASSALAVPRMSLTAGSPCATCHTSPSGGGLRNELGFSSSAKMGLLTWDKMGVDAIHHAETNRIGARVVQLGADLRYQFVRLGIPAAVVDDAGAVDTVVPDYEFFQMQFQPHLAIRATDWLHFQGSYNIGRETWSGTACDTTFAGQSCFEAFAQVTPSPELPFVRAGVFMPSIGIRHDDHTVLTRGDGLGRQIIPANYAEAGVEVGYQPNSAFRADLGIFGSNKLDESLNGGTETADLFPIAYLARIMWLPQFVTGGAPAEASGGDDDFDDFDEETPSEPVRLVNFNTWAGASFYGSGDFHLETFFLGLGTSLGGSIMLELANSGRSNDIGSLNTSMLMSWAFWDWLVVNARAEYGRASLGDLGDPTTWQFVGGIEFFPVPFIEIRPEYRFVETDLFRFGQSTVQVHLFF